MNNKCIVCGDEFNAQRYGRRFCDKPACRQKFNRQEQKIKQAGANMILSCKELLQASTDPNFSAMAKKTLLEAEKAIKAYIDSVAPDRNPKPRAVFDAKRPSEIRKQAAYWALPSNEGDLMPVKVIDIQGAWVECEILNDRNQYGYNARRCMLPENTIFVEIQERG